MKKTVVILSMILIPYIAAFAQDGGTITGTVINENSTPLSEINVWIRGTSNGTPTNEDGSFSINNVQSGTYTIMATSLNYVVQQKTVVLTEGETITVNFKLVKALEQLKEVNITTTGVTKSAQDIPGAVSVINSKAIKESGAQNIGEIITRAPGVNFMDEDGRGLKPDIGLRGLNPNRDRNVLVLVDGKFPVGMTLYGDPAGYYFMPLQQVDKIEIIKGGAASVLYGGYSVGGVVNLISKKATYEAETRADITYGSWDGLVAQVTSGRDNGKFSYYINGTRRQGSSFRDNGEFAVNDVTAKFAAKPDATSEIAIYLNGFSENSETPGGISPEQFRNDISQSNNPNDHFYSKRYSTAITYSKTLNEFNKLNMSVYGNYFERNWFIATTKPVRNGFVRDIHNTGFVADYELSRNIFGLKNSLIVGTRIHADRLDDIKLIQAEGDFSTRTGVIDKNRVNNSMIYEFYAYDELHITDKFIFTPGARFTSIEYKRKDFFANREDKTNIDAFVYTAGLVYKLKPHTSIYANVSSSFQPPKLNSSLDPGTVDGNEDLGPETSINYEIGFKTTPFTWLSANVTAYSFKFEDKIVKEAGVNKNVGESLHRGIETELELGAYRGVSLFANATFQKATFENGDPTIEGNVLPYAPERMFATGLRYNASIKKGSLIANVFMNYVGKQFNDNLNTETETVDGKNGAIPSYQVVNATISYSAKKWGINFSVFNVLDEKYFSQRNSFFGGIMPSPSRNFRAGVYFKI